MSIDVSYINNIAQFHNAMVNAQKRALMACGSNAEGYAKGDCPFDTGALRNSITHQMSGDDTVVVGTNMEYAAYVELGTGKYYPGGRTTPWRYQDIHGDWHITSGMPARPYLKPALADHTDEYHKLIQDSFKNA